MSTEHKADEDDGGGGGGWDEEDWQDMDTPNTMQATTMVSILAVTYR